MAEQLELLALLAERMPALSKGQKRIAQFLAEHYDKAVYLTAARLGEITGVSESTVVRFAIELGYEGYPHMQKALEASVKLKMTAIQRVAVASDRLTKGDMGVLGAVLKSDAERLLSTLHTIDAASFDKTVEHIISARKVYIIGGRSSAAIANFFAFYLNLMVEDVVHVNASSTAEVFEQIFRIRKGDLCIGISFPRYSQRTYKAMEYACSKKATVVAITDSVSAPIAEFADYTLMAQSSMLSFVDSLVAPMSVINALLAAVSIKRADAVAESLDRLEQLWGEYQVYASTTQQQYQS